MQIRTRLTLQFFSVVALILLVSFSIIYISSSEYRETEFYGRLRSKAQSSAELLLTENQVDSALLRVFDRSLKDPVYLENILIFDANRQLIYAKSDQMTFALPPERVVEVLNLGELEWKQEEFEILGLSYPKDGSNYAVVAGAIDRYGKSKLRNLRTTLIVLFIVILFVISITGWIYAGRALRPISQVIDEVERISPENLSRRIQPLPFEDEIGRLINTFNKLLTRIEEAFKLQRLFVASASHELKNPLTVITSQLQVSLINERDVQSYKETISSVLEDITDLNRLTIQLMELARVNYDPDITFRSLRIDDVIWEVRQGIVTKYPEYIVDIKIGNLPQDEEVMRIQGNEALLKTAFINLAENACKFSSNHRVEIELIIEAGKLSVSFRDEGPGIPASELPYVFEPFFRSKQSTGVKGHGIGLALVRRIIALHGGEIRVSSVQGKGSVFTVEFPITV